MEVLGRNFAIRGRGTQFDCFFVIAIDTGGALRIRDAAHWGSWADCFAGKASSSCRGCYQRNTRKSYKYGRGEGIFGGTWTGEARISCRQCLSWPCQQTGSPGLRQNCSESGFSDVSVCHCLFARHFWPPPSSMQQIRGSGQERVRGGECCGSDLPGRRAQRFGHLTSAKFRRSTFGGRGSG